MTDPESSQPATDPDPFAALGNEIRLRIVDALYEGTEPMKSGTGLAYSTLREAAGVDDKGQFNYHLDVLRERFVTKGEGGYRLTFAGFEVAKTIRVGVWTDPEDRAPVEVEASSPLVGGDPLYASYRDSLVRVHGADDDPVFQIAVRPVGAADRDTAELVDLMATLLETAITQAQAGICPYCHAEPEGAVRATDEARWTHCFVATCPSCGPLFRVPVGTAVVRHPAVVGWYWEHGVDLREQRLWTLDLFGDIAVTETDPADAHLRLRVARDGATLTVDLAADGQVVATREGREVDETGETGESGAASALDQP